MLFVIVVLKFLKRHLKTKSRKRPDHEFCIIPCLEAQREQAEVTVGLHRYELWRLKRYWEQHL